jgi:hypothetical protein
VLASPCARSRDAHGEVESSAHGSDDVDHLTTRTRALLVALLCLTTSAASCKSCQSCDDEEEHEEREREREHYWRVAIRITGKGRVKTFIPAFDCRSDGERATGECGPKLVTFKELHPATLEAVADDGWTLGRWSSEIREKDGSVHARQGPMPDGRVYLNGFGYTDTGALETVTAVFVPLLDASAADGDDARHVRDAD